LGIRKYKLSAGQVSAVVCDSAIGAMAGAAFLSAASLTGNSALLAAGLAGYVGADIVESLHKIHMKRGATWV